ncbi:MAG: AAA family ATPase [Oscillospiraceae bacterium]|nr:AAA family ATPase [Oscillospiraceae bacterium]
MAFVIAVVGKGGVGKTTLSGMLVQYLCHNGKKPVLAVDADSNSNLNEVLGLEITGSLGEIREELDSNIRGLIEELKTKGLEDYTFSRMNEAITKGDGYDLLVMGRSQGKGCYCYVNDLLRNLIAKVSENYPFMLVDNAAGMEHISREILPKIDVVILVSDCSRRGIMSAGRIQRLVKEIGHNPSVMGLVVNAAPDGVLDEGTIEEIENQELELIGIVPQDDEVFSFDSDGIPLISLPETSPVKQALHKIFQRIGV